MKELVGTGVAIITPFKSDKSIDFSALERLIEYLITHGIDYIVALGTTGESATLSKEEKKRVLHFIIEKVNGHVPIVAGFGGNNTKAVVESIQDYGDFSGISAILSVAPYYNKPSQRGIIEHYKTIADVSPVPVILYNVPGRTKVNISAETTLELAQHKNIVAVKEASGNIEQIMQILKNKPREFMVISGDDALTFPLITLGASGVISVVAMARPTQTSNMVRYALEGEYDKARDIHYKLLDLIQAIFEDGNPSGIKAALHILGLIENNLRLPLVPVKEETYEKIKNLLS